MRNLMKNWNAYIANKQTTELPPFPAHAFGSHYLKRTTYVEIITRMLDTHKCRMARDDMPALGLADTTIAASTPLLQRRSLEGGEQSQWTSRMVQVFANAHSAAQSELCVAHPSAGAVPARTNRQHLVKRFSGPLGQVLLLVKLVLLMGIVWRVFLRPYDFFFKEPCYFFYRHHVPATRPEMLQLTPTF